MAGQSLLDRWTAQMGCMDASELRGLPPAQRGQLARRVENVAPYDWDLQQWNAALTYLTNARPEQTAQAAQQRLVALLRRPQNAG